MGKPFDLTGRGCSIKSFELEVLTGRDSLDAAARAMPPPPSDGSPPPPINALAANIAHRNQLIAQSISAVDGDPVVRPYTAWEGWSLRTQEFVVGAYMRLNEATKEELDGFLKAHFG